MMLDQCKKGQKLRIMSISDNGLKTQAIRFGISEGAVVTCEEVVPAGPVVVRLAKQQIAIGRNLAKSILVESL
ncbi:FeoA family protein [Desulforamulus ruminis]|uniref:FeoA family protein n=1 Tax=Desulforamulus ruminis (strain ATCC 23193 / DSM 2154 / NCIMB 8452 / DL) TaxID=696281 RepID=F6DKT7_DESRL|nr:ferrous iron transport protein A [Desulforamulus ruminis]AEG61569.1 FeoA family protein [Desulforamulus ruminis DSM 2154]